MNILFVWQDRNKFIIILIIKKILYYNFGIKIFYFYKKMVDANLIYSDTKFIDVFENKLILRKINSTEQI